MLLSAQIRALYLIWEIFVIWGCYVFKSRWFIKEIFNKIKSGFHRF